MRKLFNVFKKDLSNFHALTHGKSGTVNLNGDNLCLCNKNSHVPCGIVVLRPVTHRYINELEPKRSYYMRSRI